MIGEFLSRIARDHGVSLDLRAQNLFSTYYTLLETANQTTNLTRIIGEENTAYKHFLDSLAPLWLSPLPSGAHCLDMGAGAGFPSVPLAIVRPDLSMTLVDSVGKKVAFLQDVSDQLGLGFSALHGRSEDLGHNPAFRECFDVALARAVAPLPALCELTLPFVRVGGCFYAWKGPGAQEEIDLAKKAIDVLGGRLRASLEYPLGEQQEMTRTLVLIDKVRPTPPNYPRKPANIKNKPIRC